MLRIVNDSEVNKVSKEILDYLKLHSIKPGEVAKFRLLTGVKNTDNDKHDGDILYPASVAIPLQSTLYDPGANDGAGATVKVLAIQTIVNGDITPQKYVIRVKKNDPIFFISGSAENTEMYSMMLLVDENKNNPFRDITKEPIFELVDDKADSKKRSDRRNVKYECYNAIKSWNNDETKVHGASYNIPVSLPIEVIKERLETIAEKDPTTFYKTIDSEEAKVKSIINMAKEGDVIAYNAHEHKWIMTGSGETIAMLNRVEGQSEVDQFAQVLLSGANGPKLRSNIEKILKKNNS